MSNTHLSKRSKQTKAVDPPEFHVRSGPRPDPHASSQPANWFVAMACRIALQIFQWTLTLWTLAKAFSSRSWIFILEHTYFRNIPLCILEDRARLTKIPHHLALIVSKERAWINRSATQWDSIIQDICNTCVWSSELGVQELSVFESSGTANIFNWSTQLSSRIHRSWYHCQVIWSDERRMCKSSFQRHLRIGKYQTARQQVHLYVQPIQKVTISIHTQYRRITSYLCPVYWYFHLLIRLQVVHFCYRRWKGARGTSRNANGYSSHGRWSLHERRHQYTASG